MDNNLFEKFVVNNELIVHKKSWSEIKEKYDEDFLRQEISDAIEKFDVEIPYKKLTIGDFQLDFMELQNTDCLPLIIDGKWDSKFKYKYHFQDKYININRTGLKSSDYVFQKERWRCDATGYPSPEKTWKTERFRLTLLKALFSLNVEEINPVVLRNIISLRKYMAAQFRPSAAKAMYDYFKAEKVLDFSMGWGDRLLGAFASKSVKYYEGIDPNENLKTGYAYQSQFKSKLKSDWNCKYHIGCAEDENVVLDETNFDMIFTSPPYFDKEKYSNDENQSFNKHKGFDAWMNDFLFKTIELRTKDLKRGGILAINISDIYTRKKHYQICDPMNNYISSLGQFSYLGAIGLRMPKRPKSKLSEGIDIYGEPIWIWQKK